MGEVPFLNHQTYLRTREEHPIIGETQGLREIPPPVTESQRPLEIDGDLFTGVLRGKKPQFL